MAKPKPTTEQIQNKQTQSQTQSQNKQGAKHQSNISAQSGQNRPGQNRPGQNDPKSSGKVYSNVKPQQQPQKGPWQKP